MGNQPSVPQPGTKFQVIGAGLSRTGTSSFSEALRILLNGPVYHGGTQATLGAEKEIKPLIKILDHSPPKSPSEKELVHDLLRQRLDGYAAATDMPFNGLVQELVEVYPDALVICTTRDPDAWVKSIGTITNATTKWFLRFVLFPLPGMRHFVDFTNGLGKQWVELYGKHDGVSTRDYEAHIAYLKRVVPEKRLFFFDVREGWEPLCKALGKDVPKDIPFPRINDGEAIDRLAKKMINKGLMRWLTISAVVGAAIVPYYLLKR